MKTITSLDNPQFKALAKLGQSAAARAKCGMTLLDGVHLVASYCERGGRPEQLILSAAALARAEIQALLGNYSLAPSLMLSDALFKRLSTVMSPTGILAVIKVPHWAMPARITQTSILLEDVQDPGNLGSILRSAAAAGVKHIFLSKHAVDAWTPRALRAGMGAHFALRIYEQCELTGIAGLCKAKIVATSATAKKSLYNVDLRGDVVFVFGNEGGGLSQALLDVAHEVAAIPIAAGVESLNVAAAAAVCLFERMRQVANSK